MNFCVGIHARCELPRLVTDPDFRGITSGFAEIVCLSSICKTLRRVTSFRVRLHIPLALHAATQLH